MPTGTVCVTFDFDAFSLWIARGMATPGPLSRGEFGSVAVPRLLQLLASRDIPSTWFVPGHTAETFPDLCRSIGAAGHELGTHGYAHEAPSTLSPDQERAVLSRSCEVLQKLTGQAPRGNRTPGWDLTEHSFQIMIDLGLEYDSSLMSNDYTPFYARQGDVVTADEAYRFGPESPLVEMPVSWTLDDYPQFEYFRTADYVLPGLRTAKDVFGNFLDDMRYMVREMEDGIVVLTFHPQVIGRGHRLLGLERFLDEVRELGLTFERLDTVCKQFKAGRHHGACR